MSLHLVVNAHIVAQSLINQYDPNWQCKTKSFWLKCVIHSFIHSYSFNDKKVDKTQPYKIKIKSIIAYADKRILSYSSRVKRVLCIMTKELCISVLS